MGCGVSSPITSSLPSPIHSTVTTTEPRAHTTPRDHVSMSQCNDGNAALRNELVSQNHKQSMERSSNFNAAASAGNEQIDVTEERLEKPPPGNSTCAPLFPQFDAVSGASEACDDIHIAAAHGAHSVAQTEDCPLREEGKIQSVQLERDTDDSGGAAMQPHVVERRALSPDVSNSNKTSTFSMASIAEPFFLQYQKKLLEIQQRHQEQIAGISNNGRPPRSSSSGSAMHSHGPYPIPSFSPPGSGSTMSGFARHASHLQAIAQQSQESDDPRLTLHSESFATGVADNSVLQGDPSSSFSVSNKRAHPPAPADPLKLAKFREVSSSASAGSAILDGAAAKKFAESCIHNAASTFTNDSIGVCQCSELTMDSGRPRVEPPHPTQRMLEFTPPASVVDEEDGVEIGGGKPSTLAERRMAQASKRSVGSAPFGGHNVPSSFHVVVATSRGEGVEGPSDCQTPLPQPKAAVMFLPPHSPSHRTAVCNPLTAPRLNCEAAGESLPAIHGDDNCLFELMDIQQ